MHKWSDLKLTDEPIYSLKYRGDHGLISCTAQIFPEYEQFLVSAYPDFEIPEDKLGAVIEFMTYVNDDIIAGALSLEISSGQIRFKDNLSFKNRSISNDEFHAIISLVIKTIEKNIPPLIDIIKKQKTPFNAYIEIYDNDNKS